MINFAVSIRMMSFNLAYNRLSEQHVFFHRAGGTALALATQTKSIPAQKSKEFQQKFTLTSGRLQDGGN